MIRSVVKSLSNPKKKNITIHGRPTTASLSATVCAVPSEQGLPYYAANTTVATPVTGYWSSCSPTQRRWLTLFHEDNNMIKRKRETGTTSGRISNSLGFSSAASSSSGSDNDDSDNEEKESHNECYSMGKRAGIRNIAIIAHVDHGKTTMVDQLLRLCSEDDSDTSTNSSDDNDNDDDKNDNNDRLLDCGELEKERGITITSKVTRLHYNTKTTATTEYNDNDDGNVVINVVDTPGHADFSGEVDRILSMVDGVCLLVDASEGPMTQTKYVLSRALTLGLKPLVVINKVDRPEGIIQLESCETESKILELFDELGATEEQMDYTTLYASAKEGWVTTNVEEALSIASGETSGRKYTMKGLLDCVLEEVPDPAIRLFNDTTTTTAENNNSITDPKDVELDKFSLAAVTVGYDQYLGRMCTGRIVSGSISTGDSVTVVKKNDDADNSNNNSSNGLSSVVSGVFVTKGVSRVPLEPPAVAYCGDIVTLAGVPDSILVGDTVTKSENEQRVFKPIETPPLVPPTLRMDFGPNNGPLAGKEGTICAASKISNRLVSETDNNVTLTIDKGSGGSDVTTVFARGELQLGILIEQMRREGFEFTVSPPQVLTKQCAETGKKLEPFEEVVIDVDTEYSGTIVSGFTSDRKGTLIEMSEGSDGKSRLIFHVPSRGLIGFNSELASVTKGSAVMNHMFLEDREYTGELGVGLEQSKLISTEFGKATYYALGPITARGTLFVEPGEMVYPGMVIGELNKSDRDLNVNPVRAKQLTNIRSKNADEKVYLPPPTKMRVEELIGYMNADEIIEVTPKNIRLRKAELDAGVRERAQRSKKQAQKAAKEGKK